eukprot:TRINITY_DN13829_c0_g1_i1.p1 TRINITY_DN13829_c0_g1~~TRINITY_DN13829_c0_g1_i1.p1  ORF type:complete len:201 (+),score=11.20 TRINITY_DN13829_c0_g1_i1:26-628(+)
MARPTISLTDFVSVISKSGTPKLTQVKKMKNRGAYSPAGDYYKRLREQLVKVHSHSLEPEELEEATQLAHKSRRGHYVQAINGYRKWWGKKDIVFHAPVRGYYNGERIDVRVNPELGLEFGGKQYLVKLHLKTDPLPKNKAILLYQMMEETLRPLVAHGTEMAVLDARRSKLHTFSAPDSLVATMLRAELQFIESVWDEV